MSKQPLTIARGASGSASTSGTTPIVPVLA